MECLTLGLDILVTPTAALLTKAVLATPHSSYF